MGITACSALAVLASSSGVSGERQAFMELVKNEIERLNKQMNSKGSLSMVFRSGGVTVRPLDLPLDLSLPFVPRCVLAMRCLHSTALEMVWPALEMHGQNALCE